MSCKIVQKEMKHFHRVPLTIIDECDKSNNDHKIKKKKQYVFNIVSTYVMVCDNFHRTRLHLT